MPYYKGVLDALIADGKTTDARAVAARLLGLRNRLKKELPSRNVLSSLLLATWNLREFGADHKQGKRLDESLLYIAEIISHFDLVAVQEINQNLDSLQRLMKLLGNWWDYLVTDVTLGASGNSERIAFVYDGRKVRFDHLAGELALPPIKKQSSRQPARSPFICAFRVGWRRVSLCSVHIYYGTAKPNDPTRVAEIAAISGALAKRNEKRQNVADGEPENVVLLGDFNIFNAQGDRTSAALARNKFVIPDALRNLASTELSDHARGLTGSNLARDKHFDQMAFHDPRGQLKASRSGVFDFQTAIYGPDDATAYRSAMQRSAPAKFKSARKSGKALTTFYRTWRTFQVSDHLPLWVELQTDFADRYLASVMHAKPSASVARASQRQAFTTAVIEPPPPIANEPAKGLRRAGLRRPRKK